MKLRHVAQLHYQSNAGTSDMDKPEVECVYDLAAWLEFCQSLKSASRDALIDLNDKVVVAWQRQ